MEMKIFQNSEEVNQLEIAEVSGNIPSKLVEEVLAFAKEGSYACLSAPQLGINQRFFVMEGKVFTNPFMESLSSRSANVFEVCENFPELRIESVRYPWCEISYQDGEEAVTRRFKDEEAQYVQFCMDWLDSTVGKTVETIKQNTIKNESEIGRNDPCTCGSGKKYKKCCGK